MSVSIGSPGTTYSLLFDPGSSNTWIGASKPYVNTASSNDTGQKVSVAYGSGSFSGEEYLDELELGGAIVVHQSIGVASISQGLPDLDGILGLGPVALTKGTLTDSTEVIPTVLDNMVAGDIIEASILTITGADITLGIDGTNGAVYAPLTTAENANNFWGFDASISYGASAIVAKTSGIIDHGSTLTLLPTKSLNAFIAAVGAKVDDNAGLPGLASCDGLDPIVLSLGGKNISIPVENYRWPQELNGAIGGDPETCYLGLGDLGSDFDNLHRGPGPQFRPPSMVAAEDDDNVNFILGYNMLKHYAVVLDAENSRIGIA